MSIFTRREIQRRLNALAPIVRKRKLEHMVSALNIEGTESNCKRDLESLATAWEIIVVSGFAGLGQTWYERRISNGKTPDIFFSGNGVTLLADVVTVSDDQQHKKNPADDFSNILLKMWRDLGVQKGGLSWKVEGVDLEPKVTVPKAPFSWGPLHLSSRLHPIGRRSIKRLALPPADHLAEYMRKKTQPFFHSVLTFPDTPAHIEIDEWYTPDISVRFSLSYDPRGEGICGHYPSYTTLMDIERHVLWHRLTEKSEQFAHATEEVPRVLFVCDGGCAALYDTLGGGPHGYHCEELLDHFWKRPVPCESRQWSWVVEHSISGVVLLPIRYVTPGFAAMPRRDFTIKASLCVNPYATFPLNKPTLDVLAKVVSGFPPPVESPKNVLRAIRANEIPSRRLGTFSMSHNRIEISAVKLLRILSGELTLDEFCRDHGLPANPFKAALMGFQCIKSIRVEPVADRDDDRVIIEFGPPDPAFGPFVVPESSE